MASMTGAVVMDNAVSLPEERTALLERILSNPLLPSPPTLALQIVEKTRQPDCSAAEIGNLLVQDPALCGKVLQTLNSSLYAMSQPVTSLQRAVAILGLKPLRSLVLGLTLPAVQARMPADHGLRRYWKESVAGAITARELARKLRYPSPEDDLVASLLRDLGMILLRQTFPEEYEPIWSGNGEIPARYQCAWEQQHLGLHHAEVSAALLASWGLPAEIVEPVRYHHQPDALAPERAELAERAGLLEFTGRLAQLEDQRCNRDFFQGILQTAKDRFGLERAELEDFLGEVRRKVEDFATVLRVDIGACPNFAEVLAAGCQELIRLSVEAAAEQSRQRLAAAAGQGPPDAELPGQTQEPGLAETRVTCRKGPVTARHLFARLEELGPGTPIQHYEIESFIGRGAMGIVLQARDILLDRSVALKILAPELADSPEAHKRFALEARYAAAIRHENVVTIFAVSEVDGVPFLVMEYVPGRSLQERLDACEPFTIDEIASIARQTASGLAAAHALRLIHRDIKPANLLLDQDGRRIRITDFGLARALDADPKLSCSGTLTGTPLYMSPEQVDGKPLTPASDLFSLGSVLYTLASGHTPFSAESISGLLYAVAKKTPVPIRTLNPEVPEWLAHLIEKLHAKEPEERFASAGAVAAFCREHVPAC